MVASQEEVRRVYRFMVEAEHVTMETRLFKLGCLVMLGLLLLDQSSALSAYLQPWQQNSLMYYRPQHFVPSRMATPRCNSLFGEFGLSNIFDDPFSPFSRWSMSPWSPFDIAPKTRCHPSSRRAVKEVQEKGAGAADKTNSEYGRQEAERNGGNNFPERRQPKDGSGLNQEAREWRLQREIEKERSEIEGQKALIRERQEMKRREEEEYARSEREWIERQRQRKREEEEKHRREELEKEAHRREELERAARRREEMERQNQARKKREMRAQEERRGHQKRSDTRQRQDNVRNSGHAQSPRHELVNLAVNDYNPEDISIVAKHNKMTINGFHVCGCDESCFEREFQRRYEIPRNIDPSTLRGHVDKNGVLSVDGERHAARNANVDNSLEDIVVPVDGHRLHPRNREPSCGGRKGGIKLKKMNKRTGEVLEDLAPAENLDDYYEGENGGDGITIEVIE